MRVYRKLECLKEAVEEFLWMQMGLTPITFIQNADLDPYHHEITPEETHIITVGDEAVFMFQTNDLVRATEMFHRLLMQEKINLTFLICNGFVGTD